MKNILIFLIALGAFSSCKKSSTLTDETVNQNCKLLSYDMTAFKVDYVYDSRNRITKQSFTNNGASYELPSYRTFEYATDKITVTDFPSNKKMYYTLSNNRITRLMYSVDEPNRYSDFTYNSDGYISAIKDNHWSIGSNRTLTYTNGNLTKLTVDGEVTTIEYHDKTAPSGLDMGLNKLLEYEYMLSDKIEPYIILTSFLGKQSKNLIKTIRFPSSNEYIRYDYEYDSSGKPIKITMTLSSYNNKSFSADLKWECN